MAKCEFCDKGVTFGIKVSHSHRRSNRPWRPNVKRVKRCDQRYASPCVCLYPMPAFRQGYPRDLIASELHS